MKRVLRLGKEYEKNFNRKPIFKKLKERQLEKEKYEEERRRMGY